MNATLSLGHLRHVFLLACWRAITVVVWFSVSVAASPANPLASNSDGSTSANVATENAKPGQIFRDCSDCPEMVVVPAGNFMMGSSAAEESRLLARYSFIENLVARALFAREHPQHAVTIDHDFALGRYPVTWKEYGAFIAETGYAPGQGCTLYTPNARLRYEYISNATWKAPGFTSSDREPVVCVSWRDAQAYVAWLNQKIGHTTSPVSDGPYRLPSESEWEYAARAGSQTAYWWGDAIGSGNANCQGCGAPANYRQPMPVGSYAPNPFGLFDMVGNIFELTDDCWNGDYSKVPTDGRAAQTGDCGTRPMRGGGFDSKPDEIRMAFRGYESIDSRAQDVGFRVAKTLR